MQPLDHLTVTLPGPPWSRREPEIGRRGPRYTMIPHPTTTEGKERWLWAWRSAGSPTLLPYDGPLYVYLDVFMERPKAHLLKYDALSAEGKRWPRPTMKPDLSNILKLAEDALKGHAYSDDSRITRIVMEKSWSESAATYFKVGKILVEGPDDAAE